MFTLDRVVKASGWFLLGVVFTVTMLTYLYTRPQTITGVQQAGYRLVKGHENEVGFLLIYTVPTQMRVGDIADVRERIRNLRLEFFNKKNGKVISPTVQYKLEVGENCTVKPTVDLALKYPLTFPLRGSSSDFAWTVSAIRPGQCPFVFTTKVPSAGFENINPFTVTIYERFTNAEWAIIIAALIGAVGAITAAAIIALGGRQGVGHVS